jgi:hypothetical protein
MERQVYPVCFWIVNIHTPISCNDQLSMHAFLSSLTLPSRLTQVPASALHAQLEPTMVVQVCGHMLVRFPKYVFCALPNVGGSNQEICLFRADCQGLHTFELAEYLLS